MTREISLNKEVFNKGNYQKNIDTTFKELGVKTIQEQLDTQPTVQEFFNIYDELFYQINELGPTNSHEYIVKTSGEYISFEEEDELVQALQLEIANLRKELLQTQQDLADSLGDLAEASQPLPEIEEVAIPNPVADVIDTTPEDTTPPPSDPYPNSNDLDIKYTNEEVTSYKDIPVTLKQLKKNLEYVKQNGLLLNDGNNDYSNTKDSLNKITFYTETDSLGNMTTYKTFYLTPTINGGIKRFGQSYNFGLWDDIRTSMLDNAKNKDARDNMYNILSRTVDKIKEHYAAERNYNEEGGFL